MKIKPLFCLIFLLLTAGPAAASPLLWQANGHYYEYVSHWGTWKTAYQDSLSRSFNGIDGHMVTLTSEAENDFVWSALGTTNAWLGAYQQGTPHPENEPQGDWAWVTGEAWEYTNWAWGEPNDYLWTEDFLVFSGSSGKWNDMLNYKKLSGYIIEYETPGGQVPEPGTLALFSLGLLAAAGIFRRQQP